MKRTAAFLSLLLLALSVRGAIVNFTQNAVNDTDGSSLAAVATSEWLETANTYTTVPAPESWNSFRFVRWSVDSYSSANYRDAWGRALNPISFVLFEDTTATAHYLPATLDSDGDGVPDWYKLHYFGTLEVAASDDLDGDGLTLLQEYQGETHPLYANSHQAGGVARGTSGLVTANLAGYARYTLRSEPAGAVDQSAVTETGAVITTPDLTSATFGYWTLDGEPQRDAWGVALRQISFTMGETAREAVAFFFDSDRDGDGLPDAWEEYYLGTLDYGPEDTPGGDGWTLEMAYAAGGNPRFPRWHEAGGVAWADSSSVVVNLAGFFRYTISSDPPGWVSQSAVATSGTAITTPELDQPSFAYWTLDGEPQRDRWGVALRQITFTVDDADREAIAHFVEGDSDGDGIPDAWELHYLSSLDHGADDAPGGGGWTLAAAYAAGGSPLFPQSHQAGGVSWADSSIVVVNQQLFPAGRMPMAGGEEFFANPYTEEPGSFVIEGGFSAPAMADIFGNGALDLVVGGTDGRAVLFRNVGSPFAPSLQEVAGAFDGLSHWPAGAVYPALGDWDGDGRADLAVGSEDGIVRLYRSVPGPAARFVWVANLVVGNGAVYPAFLPKPGGPNLLVLNGTSGKVLLFDRVIGDAPYVLPATNEDLLGVPVEGGTALSVADSRGDGRFEIFASDRDGRIWHFAGLPDETFSLRSKVWGGSGAGFHSYLRAAVVDFTGNGSPDIIGGGADGGLIYLRNPARTLRVRPSLQTVEAGEQVLFSTIDDDGSIEWMLSQNGSGGSIDSETGVYVAGDKGGIDGVRARSAMSGRVGQAWVNVIEPSTERGAGRGLIVAGRSGPNDPVWPAARALSARAREVMRFRGMSDADILFMGHAMDDAGVDERTSKAGLEAALRNGIVAGTDDRRLFVYMVDHGRIAGGEGVFLLSETESVTGSELAEWFDALQDLRPELDVTVVFEACYAQLLAEALLEGPHANRRLVLASAGAAELAHLAAGGLVSYSSMFWSAATFGATIQEAHDEAAASIGSLQTPWLGGASELAGLRVGLDEVTAVARPTIGESSPDILLEGTAVADLWVSGVTSSFPLEQVWAVVVPPGYTAQGDAPVVELPEIPLRFNSSTQRYEAAYGGFSEGGPGQPYTVLIYAKDIWGQVSAPAQTQVTQLSARNRVIVFAHGEVLWEGASIASALAAYSAEVALLRRVREEDVFVVSDFEALEGASGEAGVEVLRDAILQWAQRDELLTALTIYAVGQGSPEGLACANGEVVTPADLKSWLDELQDASGATVQVIVDGDYSGRFAQESGSSLYRRILIASTGPNDRNYFNGTWASVSRWLWQAVARGRDLRQSYAEAEDIARLLGTGVPPLFDDTGGDTTLQQDGLRAINAFVGSAFVTANDPPFIGRASAAQPVGFGGRAAYWVADVVMPDGGEPMKVWSEMIAPDGGVVGGMELYWNPVKERYEGYHGNFSQSGRYTALVQAGTPGDPSRTTSPVLIYFDCEVSAAGASSVVLSMGRSLPLTGEAMDAEFSPQAASQTFRLQAKRGQRLVIETFNVTSGRNVALELLDAEGARLATADRWGAGFGEKIGPWEAPVGAWYQARVTLVGGGSIGGADVRAYLLQESGGDLETQGLPQSLTFELPSEVSTDAGSVPLTATASSGLPVFFAVLSGPAIMTGTDLVLTGGTGSVVVRARQDGDATYNAAIPVEQTIQVIASDWPDYETWARQQFGDDYATMGGPEQDADGDGFTNYQEWLARTDPTSASDRLEVGGVELGPDGFSLRWFGREGVSYRVLVSTDLIQWVELESSRVMGRDQVIEVMDADNRAVARFYRVEVTE
jgi:hypothetical protein